MSVVPVNAATLRRHIEGELSGVADERVASFIRALLVEEPRPVLRPWDYGPPGQQYPCWIVLEWKDTGIAYCNEGFGPSCPWGLIFLEGEGRSQSIGMDCSWFATFLEAVQEEPLAGLPVWRVFRTTSSGEAHAITEQAGWDDTWRHVMVLRCSDPHNRYTCETDVLPRKESLGVNA